MSPLASVTPIRLPSSPAAEADIPPVQAVLAPAPKPDSTFDVIDRSFHATLARFTGGLSPAAVALAFADWQLHLLAAPGKRTALAGEAIQHALQFAEAL